MTENSKFKYTLCEKP